MLNAYKKQLDDATRFIPLWVKIAVAIALGLGTMVGWKRIVVTVGEKIGKTHLTYAQGASAELVAMPARSARPTCYGLPVSTTHVLSSGVAGTMAANRSGLQMATVRNLLMAWVLTCPRPSCSRAGSTSCSSTSVRSCPSTSPGTAEEDRLAAGEGPDGRERRRRAAPGSPATTPRPWDGAPRVIASGAISSSMRLTKGTSADVGDGIAVARRARRFSERLLHAVQHLHPELRARLGALLLGVGLARGADPRLRRSLLGIFFTARPVPRPTTSRRSSRPCTQLKMIRLPMRSSAWRIQLRIAARP